VKVSVGEADLIGNLELRMIQSVGIILVADREAVDRGVVDKLAHKLAVVGNLADLLAFKKQNCCDFGIFHYLN
jgi:hypothetical protein